MGKEKRPFRTTSNRNRTLLFALCVCGTLSNKIFTAFIRLHTKWVQFGYDPSGHRGKARQVLGLQRTRKVHCSYLGNTEFNLLGGLAQKESFSVESGHTVKRSFIKDPTSKGS